MHTEGTAEGPKCYLTLSSASRTAEEQSWSPREEARKMAEAQEGDWEGFSLSALPSQSVLVATLTPFHVGCFVGDGERWYLLGDQHPYQITNGTRWQSSWLGFGEFESSPSNTTDCWVALGNLDIVSGPQFSQL